MIVRRYRRITAFHKKADFNYLEGLNECHAAIMKAHLEISFITIATKTQLDPTFLVEGEGAIASLVPLDNEYEPTANMKESKKRW